MKRDRAGAVFSALSDSTRREVLMRVSQEGPLTATDLASRLPVSRQAVSKHLAALEEAGLVSGEKVGREHRYRATPAPMAEAVGWISQVGAEWDERLRRLRRQLER